jgi:hypothetical protein
LSHVDGPNSIGHVGLFGLSFFATMALAKDVYQIAKRYLLFSIDQQTFLFDSKEPQN